MKKKILKTFSFNNKKLLLPLLISTMISISCKKQKIEINTNKDVISANESVPSLDIKQRDGMLEFSTQKDFYETINLFSTMSNEQLIAWGKQNNFKTQQIIFAEICQAEEEFDANYFKGIPEDATLEELNELGKPINFSNLYKKYLKSGLIKQVVDETGYSFNLNVVNPLFSYVFNTNNMCIVNDTLYYMNNDKKLFIQKKYNTIVDIENITRVQKQTNSTDYLIFDLDFENNRANTSFFIDNIWTQSGDLNNVTWYYDSGTERFRHYVSLGSSIYTSTLHVSYVTESIAEKKKHGKWRRRLGYKPIDYISGSWDYWYTDANGTNIWNSLGDSDDNHNESSGYYDNPNWMKNKIKNYLEPSGTFTLNNPIEAIHIENMHIQGYFIGSTGNYYTNYYH